ncbi:MAG: twin-arginine translocation signal domain-containing protein [Candidatus Acidiferrales bacterium]
MAFDSRRSFLKRASAAGLAISAKSLLAPSRSAFGHATSWA